jgi:hypothetical protein
MGGEMSEEWVNITKVEYEKMIQDEIELANANAKIADLEAKLSEMHEYAVIGNLHIRDRDLRAAYFEEGVRALQGYTMEGCYLVKSESPFKGNWNGDYVATADLEKLLFSPTMRAVDEEVEG